MHLELTDCLSRCQTVHAQNLDSVRVNVNEHGSVRVHARPKCKNMTAVNMLPHVVWYSPSPHLPDSFPGVETANFKAGALALRAVI
jgi:hypothetical protein